MNRRTKQTLLQKGRHTDDYEAYEKMLKFANYQRKESQKYNEISLHISQNGHNQNVYKP